jgi:hypothetical protein
VGTGILFWKQFVKTLLICHEGNLLNRHGLARWLNSFSNLVGIVSLQEGESMFLRRVRSEVRRIGLLRMLDVLAFRVFYKLRLAKGDAAWARARLAELLEQYEDLPSDLPVLMVDNPNRPEVEEFIRRVQPDLAIARCKQLIKQRVFSIPRCGTFIMHPGICPEYRNSHGCFWALAKDDRQKVGMTLLKIDPGVDTGPVYGYYTSPFDEVSESHVVIQNRMVLDNLDALQQKLLDIGEGRAEPLDVKGRPSAVWGQPWLTAYLRWKSGARRKGSAC